MNFKLASMDDLPQLKDVYKKIIRNMDENKVQIWDEVYPCEFFEDDIINKRLYILVDNSVIVSAFALCHSNAGEGEMKWDNANDKALYIERFAVNLDYLRKGLGGVVIDKAITISREMGAKYLRLFVVAVNEPAIKLYIKNGFKKVDGIYNEIIDDDLVLRNFGFEIRT